jgi:hypothetical protein
MSKFTIMNASCLTNNKSIKCEDITESSSTILVCKRHTSDWNGKTSKIFVRGSGSDYGVKVGDVTTYTQDTGMGYKCKGYSLEVENVITVDINGNIVSELPITSEKRRLWVMK